MYHLFSAFMAEMSMKGQELAWLFVRKLLNDIRETLLRRVQKEKDPNLYYNYHYVKIERGQQQWLVMTKS